MLFNSFVFVIAFLPLTAALFFCLARLDYPRGAEFWLILASVGFYGWWNFHYVYLLLGSILFNFFSAGVITKPGRAAGSRRAVLALSIAVNLVCLFYFKYFNFFSASIAAPLGLYLNVQKVSLPIGISFFTFTQIAFLVDAYAAKVREKDVLNYGLFVTYFPHLIAGPVLHHSEMMPQFASSQTYTFSSKNVVLGLAYFLIGIVKKVGFADSVAPFADHAFNTSDPLSMAGAWEGVLSYTLQIYFDFSGYSDMAIGLSKIFNVDLPLNFDSPYKSKNIIEFWRRWHMTLSRFLRDYLYIPLGGSRNGSSMRFRNLMLTMLLGGLWHGANWTFIVWGGIHGIYLIVNHGFTAILARLRIDGRSKEPPWDSLGWALTFLAVVIAWVFFRASSVTKAIDILRSMIGRNRPTDPFVYDLPAGLLPFLGSTASLWIIVLTAIALITPNSQEIMHQVSGSSRLQKWVESPLCASALIVGCWLSIIFCVSINETRLGGSPFIYFNF